MLLCLFMALWWTCDSSTVSPCLCLGRAPVTPLTLSSYWKWTDGSSYNYWDSSTEQFHWRRMLFPSEMSTRLWLLFLSVPCSAAPRTALQLLTWHQRLQQHRGRVSPCSKSEDKQFDVQSKKAWKLLFFKSSHPDSRLPALQRRKYIIWPEKKKKKAAK